MKDRERPKQKDIEELTPYLPRRSADGFMPILSQGGGEKLKDDSISMPYPNYSPLVEEFSVSEVDLD